MAFSFFSNFSKKVGGEIAYYKLNDWWKNTLTSEERNIIRSTYKPLNSNCKIDEGVIQSSSQSKLSYLSSLTGWFKKKEHYELAVKIINEGEKSIPQSDNILDVHFFFQSAINIFYSRRNDDNNALDISIEYCKKQIDISKKVKKAFLKEYPNSPLPTHIGYKQLAIIYEKQKKFDEALKITKKALAEGWNIEDCNNRIEKLNKKI